MIFLGVFRDEVSFARPQNLAVFTVEVPGFPFNKDLLNDLRFVFDLKFRIKISNHRQFSTGKNVVDQIWEVREDLKPWKI